ncbi:phosphate ABC transporter substrate-binding/OmpA family protein [Yoonia sediminilitoris]|uniref:Phosphate ABC transporter substrate-binding protein (PhoT family) n=1 Tax=Yoonia sediminilitoris TaxID=1286148 RepID=A0A2T6KQ51_9RHOB|nr:phosphate ABC transporter substrate-binding/OmpA family protein [Yoonia sediminilitoris]PUB18684.1 phosphate ABC transporter substrate-binding protein (PhoT family) [Yoonia sediminilitoris]RCW98852.1 phosphate ABC transporter substrate-binding protein (PhoT family) [Yoonia sediminilitoris]
MLDHKKRTNSLFAIMLASVAIIPCAANAQSITLTSNDGSINIVGDFIDLVDDYYIINSALGELRVEAGRVQCNGDACPRVAVAASDVVMVGSGTVGVGLVPFLIDGFATSQNGVIEDQSQSGAITTSSLVGEGGFGEPIGTFSVSATASADAFSGLRDPAVKIGMSSRRIQPAEARQLRNFGAGNLIDVNQEHVVAVDSISVIVHPNNPIGAISLADLDLIYSGAVTNWSEIGGQNAPIKVYTSGRDTGAATVFASRVFEQSGRTVSPEATEITSSEEMASLVRNDPTAIGYVATAFERGTKALALEGTCGISSAPTQFDAKTEEYPLQRRLYLYNRADNVDATTQAFIDYSMSGAADEMIAKSGFVNLAITKVPQDLQNGRMRAVLQDAVDPFEFRLAREMLLEMFEWERLSTTFRFASGSARLDGKGQADLQRLIAYLREQPAGTNISVVGFTDGDGAFGPNQELSFGRAQRVADEILAAGGADLEGINIQVKGFGELSPSACNDSLEGKRINRRVEVWIQ